jgi:hypothetical protein
LPGRLRMNTDIRSSWTRQTFWTEWEWVREREKKLTRGCIMWRDTIYTIHPHIIRTIKWRMGLYITRMGEMNDAQKPIMGKTERNTPPVWKKSLRATIRNTENIVKMHVCDYRLSLVWWIGFIDHLYTPLGTTSNYSAVANLNTLYITTTPAKHFPSLLRLQQSFPSNGV